MATFTMPLKDVIDVTGGKVEIVNGLRRLTNAECIGLAHYPIHDTAYRQTLNGKIVDHYWNREIGQESVDLFIHAMRRRMNEIMPAYELLYKSTQMTFDPLSTIDMRTVTDANATNEREVTSTAESENNGTSLGTTSGASNTRNISSQFPQQSLSDNGDYADSGVDVTGATSGTSESSDAATASQSGTEAATDATQQQSDSRVTGYQGLPSDMLMRYRESIINVDLMIIQDLEDLFMGIWDNSDNYTYNGPTFDYYYGRPY